MRRTGRSNRQSNRQRKHVNSGVLVPPLNFGMVLRASTVPAMILGWIRGRLCDARLELGLATELAQLGLATELAQLYRISVLLALARTHTLAGSALGGSATAWRFTSSLIIIQERKKGRNHEKASAACVHNRPTEPPKAVVWRWWWQAAQCAVVLGWE
jgi:hypothetical protein